MSNENGKEVEEQSASDLTKQIEIEHIILTIDNIVALNVSENCLIGQLFERAEKIVDQGKFKKWIKDNFELSYQEVKFLMNFYRNTASRMREDEKECECSGDTSPVHRNPNGKPKLSLVT